MNDDELEMLETLEETFEVEDVVKERKLIVWGGASDNTIYQDASVNQNEFILSYIKG